MNNKALEKGLSWSILEKVLVVGLQFVLEIILARILSPGDYGILGMILVVVTFANVFIDGGISSALIHFKDRNDDDYAVVFYCSLLLGLFSFALIYIFAPSLSSFYNKDLTLYIRIIAITILFNAFGVIYRAKLTIQLDFRKQTVYGVISVLISGTISIFLAYHNYGVWSLMIQLISYSFFYNTLLFFSDRTVPKPIFKKKAFDRVMGFGSKIFLSSILQAVYFNIYPILIGRHYPTKVVGLYSKANQLTILPASLFSSTIQRVFFPYMVSFQNDKNKIYQMNQGFIRKLCIILCPIIVMLIIYSNPIIIFVLTEEWKELVMPFNILLVTSIFFPLVIMNMTIFQVIGKVNLYFYTELFIKILGIIILYFTYKLGFLYLCIGILVQYFLQLLITSILSCKILEIPIFNQIREIAIILSINGLVYCFLKGMMSVLDDYLLLLPVLICILFVYIYIMKLLFKNDFQFLVKYIKGKTQMQ